MIDFTSISGTWDDKPLYIIGGGPSVNGFDFDRIKDKGRILGVNDGAFNAPCDALFSLDQTWHKFRKKEIAEFQGEKYFAAPPSFELKFEGIPDVNYIIRRRSTGFTEDKRDINGVNSGYGALHLAYHKRAKEIYLLGFDMRDKPGERISENKQKLITHWFKPYAWHRKEAHAALHKVAASFDAAKSFFDEYGAIITNASPDSLITAFDKCDIGDL